MPLSSSSFPTLISFCLFCALILLIATTTASHRSRQAQRLHLLLFRRETALTRTTRQDRDERNNNVMVTDNITDTNIFPTRNFSSVLPLSDNNSPPSVPNKQKKLSIPTHTSGNSQFRELIPTTDYRLPVTTKRARLSVRDRARATSSFIHVIFFFYKQNAYNTS